MKICAVQLRPIAGDVAANTARHERFIGRAGANSADLVFFPELSLTGYEPRLATTLAMHLADARLDVFQEQSDAQHIIIGIGVPLSHGSQVQIGMVWFTPGAPRRSYAKQQLHADELPYFVQGEDQLVLEAAGHTLAPAICYESLQSSHAAGAATLGTNVYLASVAKPEHVMARALRHYSDIARQHDMYVCLASCVGPSDDFVSVGQSAVWNPRGELLAQMDGESEGMVMVDTGDGTAVTVS
ncbi:MAG: carbon-nitrogen hydrolase family protein [Gemmatimonadaceae bacterium]